MKRAHAQGGWTVSEVEQLTGLSRRDIQRCCYQGKGGVGILEPRDSSWGRRTYSAEDVALLYLVRLEKQAGLSLPEVAQKFQAARDVGTFDALGLLAAHQARLEEQLERLLGDVLCVSALLTACSEGISQERLGELVESALTLQISYAAFQCGSTSNEKPGACEQTAGETTRPANSYCGLAKGWLTALLPQELVGSAGRCGESAARDIARKAFANAIDCLRASNTFSTCAGAREAIAFALDAPGMDLAIELWLGPGASKCIRQAIQ